MSANPLTCHVLLDRITAGLIWGEPDEQARWQDEMIAALGGDTLAEQMVCGVAWQLLALVSLIEQRCPEPGEVSNVAPTQP